MPSDRILTLKEKPNYGPPEVSIESVVISTLGPTKGYTSVGTAYLRIAPFWLTFDTASKQRTTRTIQALQERYKH